MKRPVSTGTWLPVAVFLKIDSNDRLTVKNKRNSSYWNLFSSSSFLTIATQHSTSILFKLRVFVPENIYSYLNSVVDFSEHHSRLKK